VSKNLGIFSRSSNLLKYTYSIYSLMIRWISTISIVIFFPSYLGDSLIFSLG
jgi:hypothetical protein